MNTERPAVDDRSASGRVRRAGPFALLAVLAYVPALLAAPGRMPADSKLYLYLDPARFLADAAGTFDPRQFAGWVPHQHIAYLWPSGPWFAAFELIGVPDWVAHRLWIGTLLLTAGLGARWCARQVGLPAAPALVAAIVYQVSPYIWPYVSRTSVMLLPWAGLGWIVALTIRATRRGGWRDPALIALVVLTVGAVNATALIMIVPAPVLWLLHAAWARLVTWRAALLVAVRTAVLSCAVSVWWLVALVVQSRFGADVLPYSEALEDVSLTSTAAEVWRGLGYWLFYLRDPYAATTTESLRYLTSTVAIAVSFLVPTIALVSLVWVRWIHRRFAALLVVAGGVLAVGVHPFGDRSPLMRILTVGGDDGLALALRSSTRALPVMNLGLALAAGALVAGAARAAPGSSTRSQGSALGRVAAVGVAVVAIVNMPGLWTGAAVDPALERDADPPDAWLEAAADLDRSIDDDGIAGRVLAVPGAEFGAYRWGYTVDQPLPGLTERPVVTRDLLPLGSPAAMDLLYAFDDRFQLGVGEPDSLAITARLFGSDTVWLVNDAAFDRFRTARPEVVRDVLTDSEAITAVESYGPGAANAPDLAMRDERAVADPRVGDPIPTVQLVSLDVEAERVRAHDRTVVVAGNGDGVVDAGIAGLLPPGAGIRYAADGPASSPSDVGLIVTDSNRQRARHWRGSQDSTGFTESGSNSPELLRPAVGDARLPVFDGETVGDRTTAIQVGPVTAIATSYGEPFAYLPEHRAWMAIDGDPATAWLVGEHADPIGEAIELRLAEPAPDDVMHLRQPDDVGQRRITAVEIAEGRDGVLDEHTRRTIGLDDRSIDGRGQPIELAADSDVVRVTVADVGGGTLGTAAAVAAVGFAEIDVGSEPTAELVRVPSATAPADAPMALVFTRERVDPMNRWRSDPEPLLARQFTLADDRQLVPEYTIRLDARAPDAVLAELFDWPVVASSRLTGSLRSVGAAALDGEPTTAWMSAFDGALGATLTIDGVREPIEHITLRQPGGELSRITAIEVRSAGTSATAAVDADESGVAHVALDPPIPAGTVDLEVTAIEPVTTVDRRFGDVFELPVGIAELTFDGAPSVPPLDAVAVDLACEVIGYVDGVPLVADVAIEGAGWLDGAPLVTAPCRFDGETPLTLGPGDHVVTGHAGVIRLDRVVLDDGVRDAVHVADVPPAVDIVDHGRFGGTYEIARCAQGCWFVFGEGHNPGWRAVVDGDDLGRPAILDGGFNGWWLEPSDDPVTVVVDWPQQRPLTWALVVSGLAAIGCLVLALRGRTRDRAPSTAVWFDADDPGVGLRTALVFGSVWILTSFALVGWSGVVLGAIGGIALVVTRRRRLPALVAFATVVTVAAYVTINELRWSPFPNGLWPVHFERVHQFGMFAFASLLVAALAADDASAPEAAEHPVQLPFDEP